MNGDELKLAVERMLAVVKSESGIAERDANEKVGSLGRYASPKLMGTGQIVEFNRKLYLPEDAPNGSDNDAD